MKLGDVATVALIDKGSVIVAILLAWLIVRIMVGASLMLLGLFVIARK